MPEHEKTPYSSIDNSDLNTVQSNKFPLISFTLFAYNQERFIREAVEGALAQTYSPLEIILSDDCSNDKTFEVMQSIVDEYTGPHRIILNKNSANLGIGRHINRLMRLSSGEIIVAAAGDDVSLPHRCEKVAKCFLSNPDCMAAYSSMIQIDETGRELGIQRSPNATSHQNLERAVEDWCPGVLGASHAWRRQIFDVFGPINPRVVTEDRVLPLRSVLLGRIVEISEPLIRYRLHSSGVSQSPRNWSSSSYFSFQAKTWRQALGVLRTYRKDLTRYAEIVKADSLIDNAIQAAKRRSRVAFIKYKFFGSIRTRDQITLLILFLLETGNHKEAGRLIAARFFPSFYLRRISKRI